MKLIRYGKAGFEKPGVIYNQKRYDTSALTTMYDEVFFEDSGLVRLEEYIKANHPNLPQIAEDERLGCPVARPSKIVCIGLNYAGHAKEINAPLPVEPVIFMKSTTAITGPDDDVIIPRYSNKTDWEVELAVVISRKASYIPEDQAGHYIAGYLLHNDLSERAYQLERNGTWDKGKGCDTFAHLGPFLATPDEIGDINNIRLWLKLNGKIMQNGNTADLIFKIPYLISYVSQFMTLLPGDIISTGTPAGVGMGFDPPRYLKPGDIIELGIDGLGTQKQVVWPYNQIDNAL